MNRKPKIESECDKIAADWTAYKEFKDLWEIGTLTEGSLVYQKVESSSLEICKKYDRTGEVMFVTNKCLSALASMLFRRESSLDESIRNIIQEEIVSLWNSNSDVQAALERMEEEVRELRILQEVFRRIETEPFMRAKLAEKRERQEKIIDDVLSEKGPPASRPALLLRSEPNSGESPGRRFIDKILMFFGIIPEK